MTYQLSVLFTKFYASTQNGLRLKLAKGQVLTKVQV
jgi:hypothetical protein